MFSARVTGTVQGVGFRAWAQFESSRLGLSGYVRNLSDKSVEVVASGDRDGLDTLLALLRSGPPAGTVLSVDVDWSGNDVTRPPDASVTPGFEIRF